MNTAAIALARLKTRRRRKPNPMVIWLILTITVILGFIAKDTIAFLNHKSLWDWSAFPIWVLLFFAYRRDLRAAIRSPRRQRVHASQWLLLCASYTVLILDFLAAP